MASQSDHWTDRFLPDTGSQAGEDEPKKHQNLVFVCFLTAILAFAYLAVSVLVDFPVGIYAMGVSGIVFVSLPFALRAGAHRVVVANLYLAVVFLDTVLITSLSGGLSTSITSPYIAIVPMLGVMLINQKAGWIWFAAVMIEVAAFGMLELSGFEFPMTLDPEFDAIFKLAAFLGLVVIVFLIVRDFDSRAELALQQVEEEQDRTQRLLLNILPEDVAEELKATGHARANEFDEVTILFSDFENFTEISSEMTPAALVDELNACFFAFDAIVREHGLEKIKTIGDAYMAACGLSTGDSPASVNVINAALDMQAFVAQHREDNLAMGKPAFNMRAGIHTGSVVAGVVGDSKFQYDVWGDTVNMASRMETCGMAGEVNLSHVTYTLVSEEPGLTFIPRGPVPVKGKGDLEMFFVRKAPGL